MLEKAALKGQEPRHFIQGIYSTCVIMLLAGFGICAEANE